MILMNHHYLVLLEHLQYRMNHLNLMSRLNLKFLMNLSFQKFLMNQMNPHHQKHLVLL